MSEEVAGGRDTKPSILVNFKQLKALGTEI